MKATEVRIGNLVKYHDDDTLFIVTKIDDLGIGVKNQDQETWIEYECFSGIKLTKEWLVKFGFYVSDSEGYQGNSFTEMSLGKKPYAIFKLLRKDNDGWKFESSYKLGKAGYIDYLHQLQNLYYALTGEELIYEL